AGIQIMAAGLMNARFPVTCNGANLAYRRAAFERVGGFEGVGDVISGDDDLLMQKIARGRAAGVRFVTGIETAVRTGAAGSLGEFLGKRARWASKIGRYPSVSAVALMAAFFAFFAAIPIWLGLAAAHRVAFFPLAVIYGLKTICDLVLAGYGVYKIGKLRLMLMFPLAEILHVPYIIFVSVKGLFGSFEWRGRRTGAVSVERGKTSYD
ncbi:hypothetical protein LLG96_10510, partial [bacterium]|nr:hypothetical protein [bacterium]